MSDIPIDGENGFKIEGSFFLPPLALTQEEAIAVVIALDSHSKSYGQGLKSARDKIATVLNKSHYGMEETIKDRIVTMEKPKIEYQGYDKIFADFRYAIFKSVSVKITYKSLSSGEKQRVIDPYAMFYRDQGWYIIAYCHQRQDLLLFRVDRIVDNIVQYQNKFQRPQHFTVDSYMGNAWNVERGKEEFELVVNFSKEIAPLIKKNIFHQTQKIKENEDKSLVFTARVSGEKEILSWLMGLGPEAEIIAPASLRDKLKEKIMQMAEAYKCR